MNSLNTTVYRQRAAVRFQSTTRSRRFRSTFPKPIKAGDNEVMVGIRDAWYGALSVRKNR
jgi:hypothetical protein